MRHELATARNELLLVHEQRDAAEAQCQEQQQQLTRAKALQQQLEEALEVCQEQLNDLQQQLAEQQEAAAAELEAARQDLQQQLAAAQQQQEQLQAQLSQQQGAAAAAVAEQEAARHHLEQRLEQMEGELAAAHAQVEQLTQQVAAAQAQAADKAAAVAALSDGASAEVALVRAQGLCGQPGRHPPVHILGPAAHTPCMPCRTGLMMCCAGVGVVLFDCEAAGTGAIAIAY
jgi:chromosome segregation ATPase